MFRRLLQGLRALRLFGLLSRRPARAGMPERKETAPKPRSLSADGWKRPFAGSSREEIRQLVKDVRADMAEDAAIMAIRKAQRSVRMERERRARSRGE